MLVKFLSNPQGGGIGAVNYCLNDRTEQGTARVIKGNEAETRAIISQIPYKQKTTFGVLSFSEAPNEISEQTKAELIADFEKHLFCGMEKRVNILWIEHTDKGRLELNFIIPKIDLESGKSYNPYFHEFDSERIKAWQQLQNDTHKFTDPQDPAHAQSVSVKGKGKNIKELLQQGKDLETLLYQEVAQGNLNSKAEIIQLLQDSGIHIHRNGKDYISIRLNETDKKSVKMKGVIFENEFTDRESISITKLTERLTSQSDERSQTDISERIERNRRKLERLTLAKIQSNHKRYGERNKELSNENQPTISRSDSRASEKTENSVTAEYSLYADNSDTLSSNRSDSNVSIHRPQSDTQELLLSSGEQTQISNHRHATSTREQQGQNDFLVSSEITHGNGSNFNEKQKKDKLQAQELENDLKRKREAERIENERLNQELIRNNERARKRKRDIERRERETITDTKNSERNKSEAIKREREYKEHISNAVTKFSSQFRKRVAETIRRKRSSFGELWQNANDRLNEFRDNFNGYKERIREYTEKIRNYGSKLSEVIEKNRDRIESLAMNNKVYQAYKKVIRTPHGTKTITKDRDDGRSF